MLTPSVRASSPCAASTGRAREAEIDPAVDAGLAAVAGGALLDVGDGAHHRVLGLQPPGSETTRGWANDAMSVPGACCR